jgi:hypothetical protein
MFSSISGRCQSVGSEWNAWKLLKVLPHSRRFHNEMKNFLTKERVFVEAINVENESISEKLSLEIAFQLLKQRVIVVEAPP